MIVHSIQFIIFFLFPPLSHLDEDATENGLRTELRKRRPNAPPRRSLRYKIKRMRESDPDESGDVAGVTMRDLERILGGRGLPTSASGERLNRVSLAPNAKDAGEEEDGEEDDGESSFLEKARRAFLAKLSKGELPEKEERELRERQRQEEESRREGESRWEAILENFDRDLRICDLDFTDLQVTRIL